MIQKVAVQAVNTFIKPLPNKAFQEEIHRLTELMKQVSHKDLSFDPRLVREESLYRSVYIPYKKIVVIHNTVVYMYELVS